MTTHVTEPRTFATVGAVIVGDTGWLVGIEHSTRLLTDTWSYLTTPSFNAITFETTGTMASPRAVLASAVAAILHRTPGPVVNWKDHSLVSGRVVQEAHVATITTQDGDTVHLMLRYDEVLAEAYGDTFEPGDITFTERQGSDDRVVTLAVSAPTDIDLVAAITRVNAQPSGGLLG